MPSKTKKQKGAMAVCCHQPDKCKADIPQKVACEYNRADRVKAKRKKGLIERQHSKR